MTEIIYSHAVMLGMCAVYLIFNNFHSMHAQEQQQQKNPRRSQNTLEHLEAKFSGGAYSLKVGGHQPT